MDEPGAPSIPGTLRHGSTFQCSCRKRSLMRSALCIFLVCLVVGALATSTVFYCQRRAVQGAIAQLGATTDAICAADSLTAEVPSPPYVLPISPVPPPSAPSQSTLTPRVFATPHMPPMLPMPPESLLMPPMPPESLLMPPLPPRPPQPFAFTSSPMPPMPPSPLGPPLPPPPPRLFSPEIAEINAQFRSSAGVAVRMIECSHWPAAVKRLGGSLSLECDVSPRLAGQFEAKQESTVASSKGKFRPGSLLQIDLPLRVIRANKVGLVFRSSATRGDTASVFDLGCEVSCTNVPQCDPSLSPAEHARLLARVLKPKGCAEHNEHGLWLHRVQHELGALPLRCSDSNRSRAMLQQVHRSLR